MSALRSVGRKTRCLRFAQANLEAKALLHKDEKLMDECDAILANLTPFRSTGADAGTCFEV